MCGEVVGEWGGEEIGLGKLVAAEVHLGRDCVIVLLGERYCWRRGMGDSEGKMFF